MKWVFCGVFLLFFSLCYPLFGVVDLGVDVLFSEGYAGALKGKRVGLISNHTGVDKSLCPTAEVLLREGVKLVALFSPEHGWRGSCYAFEKSPGGKEGALPLFSLYGATRRPNDQMLQGIDLLIYDIQDIGVRSYTYATTLFYVMEEAARRGIAVMVLDRPNPISGQVVDGGMIEEKWRSFIGYVNVPYCHGMTIGELAIFFNEEYRVGCDLNVIPMKGWRRAMTFKDTGLAWVPTSPHIPEADTPLFYASTGILGELGIVSIGVGYTLPFKVVGAPWINAEEFAKKLNSYHLGGVHFFPFHYRPFYGLYKNEECHGVLIRVTDIHQYRPSNVRCFLMGTLKSLYPKRIKKLLESVGSAKRRLFCFANGNEEIFKLMLHEGYATWKMIACQGGLCEQFKKKRERFLLYPP